jgi:hypothetical protein
VLAQVTTNITEMTARLQAPACTCDTDNFCLVNETAGCTPQYVCGKIHYRLSVVLMTVTCLVVFILAW